MRRTEEAIQKSIVAYLRKVLPHAIVTHAANEGNRGGFKGIRDGQRKRALGQLAGFPDLLLFVDGKGYCIEVKSEVGYLSPAQKAVREELTKQGIPYAVARSVEDVRETLAEWGIETVEVSA